MQPEKVAVAVNKGKKSEKALKWALSNLLSKGDTVTIIHVCPPIVFVPTPVGNFHVDSLDKERIEEYRAVVNYKIDGLLRRYAWSCNAVGVTAEILKVESSSVEKALVQEVHELGIGKLVLGKSSRNAVTRALAGPGISDYVSNNVPASCRVFPINKKQVTTGGSFSSFSSSSDAGSSKYWRSLSTDSSTQGNMDIDYDRSPSRRNHIQIHDLPLLLSERWSPQSSSQQSKLSSLSMPGRVLGPRGSEFYISPTWNSNHNIDVTVSSNQPNCELSSSANASSSASISAPSLVSSHESYDSESSKDITEGENPDKNVEDLPIDLSKLKIPMVILEEETTDVRGKTDQPLPIRGHKPSDMGLAGLSHLQRRYKEYTFEDIRIATNNFSVDLKLGEGGYGVVYKGRLDFKDVAIKVLKKDGFQGSQEFHHEVEVLGRIHHPNMVILLGCCPTKGCLVYEYMANGSLDDRLFCKGGTPPLPWYTRFRIIAEAATALHFLHSIKPEPIVHRDFKPGNILLDRNNVSKLADVGLARLIPEPFAAMSGTYYKDTLPVGTFAYIDPEYQRTGSFGPKSDIYALGIVILQMLTGRQPLGVHEFVETAIDCGTFSDVLDRSAGEWPLAKAKEVACLALQCAEMKRKQRPELETVLPILDRARAFAEEFAAIETCHEVTLTGGNSATPPIFLCPILQELMDQPVVAADGYTYEYEAIKQWLEEHDTSPMTNVNLEHKQVIPNYPLQNLISEWKSAKTRRAC